MPSDTDKQSLAGTLVQVIGGFLARFGPLRLALLLLTIMAIVLAPGGSTPTSYEGFGFFQTLLLPTIAPLCLSGLLLDALMSRVVMGDADEAGKQRLRVIIRTELAFCAVLVITWLPFFMSIGQ